MNADLAAWLGHPVTRVLGGGLLALLFAVVEVLLRSLGDLGNVRFQGILEDHEGLLPVAADRPLHLATLLDALRWIQIAALGLLWLVVATTPGLTGPVQLLLAVAVPLILVVGVRSSVPPVGEGVVAVLLRAVRPLVWPLVATMVRIGTQVSVPVPETEEEEASDREIQAFLDVGQAAGIIEEEEGELLESLVEFFDTTVREVMTPRTEMVAIVETADYEELLELFADSRKSRIPVYRETIDHVVGVIHVKTVVENLSADRRPSVAELIRECLVVPEAKQLGELLRDFQQGHQQMAIVVDEYGGTSGLVTLEDILEEIVGEIEDEHDSTQPPDCQELSDGVFRMQGRAPTELLEEVFGIDMPVEDIDTVGGLVFSRHGTVPEAGTVVVDDVLGLRFQVEEMNERRIASVTVSRLVSSSNGASSDA